MLVRLGAVWFAIMLLAILNGAARDILLVPWLGDPVARALSCLALAALIVLVTWVSLRWIQPASPRDAWTIGVTWLAMTLIFEFVAGHYLFHTAWATLLADYNLFKGRLWILVLVATTIAPAVVFRFRAGRIPGRDDKAHMRPRTMPLVLAIVSILAGLSLAATASATSAASNEDRLLRTATLVFKRASETPPAGIPVAVLMGATAIAVIPAAVADGTRYHGDGVVSARGARADDWTPPAVIAFQGAIPLGLDTGAADFILVAQTQRGLDSFIQGRARNTATHTTAAGPLGRDTPVRINADLLVYMMIGSDVAGVALEDCVLQDVRESNRMIYGRPYSTDDIIRSAGFFHITGPVRMWRAALAAYFRGTS